MSIGRIAILLLAVVAGAYWIPHMLVVAPFERANYAADVTAKMDKIKGALNEMLEQTDGACLRGEPYLIPKGAEVTGQFTGADAKYLPKTCDRCDDLANAGLLDKTVTEDTDRGSTRFTTKFRLTKFGRSVYSENVRSSRDSNLQVVEWKFCFGKTQLHHVDEALPSMMLGGNTYVGVKYTAEVVNPNPFLFDPKSKPLRLKVPGKGPPALYEPRVTSIVFYPDGKAEVDDRFRYGKFVNQ
jgi:hypothetical protein